MDIKKILVVDEDENIVNLVSSALSDKGYAVVALTSGEQVFQAIKHFNPDLIIMDVMLAGRDGRLICSNIKEQADTKKLPVIPISSSHNLARSMQQQRAHNDFLARQLDIDVLLNRVEQQLAA